MSYYQKCPACDGKGNVIRAGTEDYKITGPIHIQCPACKGKGVLLVEGDESKRSWGPGSCYYARGGCIVPDHLVDAIEEMAKDKGTVFTLSPNDYDELEYFTGGTGSVGTRNKLNRLVDAVSRLQEFVNNATTCP